MGNCAVGCRGIAMLIAFSLLQSQVLAQPSAAFTANLVFGCSPIVVHFTDQSNGNPSQWKWDLGNGVVSYLQNPSTTYFNAGTYNVKLVVSNAAGRDSIVKNQLITVYPNPVVSFAASDTIGCFPFVVAFADQSTTSSGSITNHRWDFGDGDTSQLVSPSHIYTTAGIFSVTVKVTNSYGCVKTFSKDKYIRVNEGVVAEFNNSNPPQCSSPVTVNFANSSTGPGSLSYTWDFGDGTRTDSMNPVHTYSNPGSYTVTLTSVSSQGCSDTLVKSNLITIGTIRSQFSVPDTLCQGQSFTILNTTTPAPASASWDFGDSTVSADLNPVKKFTVPGTYVIKLVNQFSGCVDSISRSVTVKPSPAVDFSANNIQSCKVPFTVQFTNQGNAGNSYQWDFGDGGTSTDLDPTHTYTDTGSYSVSLISVNANGCPDTLTKQQYIQIKKPAITLNNLPQKGCIPLTIFPTPTIMTNDPVETYLWNFGDGTTANTAAPTHTYTTASTYQVSLIISTTTGCMDTVSLPLAVRVGDKPHAAFAASPTDVCAFQSVQFTDSSTGQVDQWLWQFGDGGTSALQSPSYLYQDTGYFSVTLITWSNTCPDTLRLKNIIHIRPPIAKFASQRNCNDRFRIDFANLSVGATSWSWNFGDGTNSIDQNPSHTYSSSGIYQVILTVTNGMCSHTATQTIQIVYAKAEFLADDTALCKGATVHFTELHTDTASIAGWHWNFGDGDTSANPTTASHSYGAAGAYTASLIITDVFGCADSSRIRVNVFGATAQFSPSVPAVCLRNNVPVLFTDSSRTDGTHNVSTRIWNYGDGTVDSTSSPPYRHLYAAAGSYDVTLTVADDYGCRDSVTKHASVVIADPKAGFYSPDTLSCTDKPVSFVNTSTGSGLQYNWDFGDNIRSPQTSPIHHYSSTGNYVVSLHITDQHGCQDSVAKSTYINISTPKASFAVSDSFTSCPPLLVNFRDSSSHFTNLRWDFGDGNNSNLENPSHYYTLPGTYSARLIVTGPGGCMDTMNKKIDVRGPKGNFSYVPLRGCQPFTVEFSATTLDRISFTWDFSDGTTTATNDSVISHTYESAGDFVPKMILQDASGCQVPIVGIDTIHVADVTAKFGIDHFKLCDSGFVNLHDSTISNDLIIGWHWDFGDGSSSDQQHPSYHYDSPGVYDIKLSVITESGCKDSLEQQSAVTVYLGPDIDIVGDSAACVHSSIKVSGQVIKGDSASMSWQWNLGNGNTFQAADPPAQTFTNAGLYSVLSVVTDQHGCKDSALKNINVYPLPTTKAEPDTLICRGGSVTLNVTGANNYLWKVTGLSCATCDDPLASPLINTVYAVTGSNQYGCSSEDSVLVRVQQPLSLQLGPNDTICLGESVVLSASGSQLYSWSPSLGLDNPSLSSPRASPSASTVYTVIAKDSANCFPDTGSVFVKVFPIPTVDAGPDQTIDVGSNVQLHATGSADVVSWKWVPSLGLSCLVCPDPTASPKQTTDYTIEVKNAGNCLSSDRVTVYVICNQGNLFLPNAFSPNGDGMNDRFYPRGKGVFLVRSLRVFDRWGELVFERMNFNANDANAGWDGTFKGKLLSPDVYVYTCEIVCENNEILKYKGDVTLLR